jgi:hypothetical protein
MATLERPLKEGNVRTYQAKVGLGFPDILAGEVDADLDTIYAAWNGGLLVNSVGELQLIDGSVTTPKLAPSAVESAKLAVGAVGPRELIDAGVTLAKLNPGSTIRQMQSVVFTAGASWNYPVWTDLITIPLTTSGGWVLLLASLGLYGGASAAGFYGIHLGWGRNQTEPNVSAQQHNFGSTATNFQVPIPSPIGFDHPPAGAHVYHLATYTGAATLATAAAEAGGCWVIELA